MNIPNDIRRSFQGVFAGRQNGFIGTWNCIPGVCPTKSGHGFAIDLIPKGSLTGSFGFYRDDHPIIQFSGLSWPEAVAEKRTMIGEHNVALEKPLTDMAWTILEAANDLGDRATVEACRRIIDASYRGENQAQSDLGVMFRFFE